MNVLLLVLGFLFPVIYGCPDPKELHPCTCVTEGPDGYRWVITCSGLDNVLDLQKAMAALKPKKYVFYIIIEDSAFHYLPHDIFEGVKFAMLLIRRSTFASFTDTETALEGLEKNLLGLAFEDFEFMSEWKWSTLKHLQFLVHVHFKHSTMEAIRKDIEVMSGTFLGEMNFIDCGIYEIEDHAFAKFSRMKSLSVSRNYISKLKRSIFPNPAKYLRQLDFSNNELTQLPADMFTNMPELWNLDLYGNQLITISESAFKPIWTALRYIDIAANPISCDCRLKWMVGKYFPQETSLVCAGPKSLVGKKITTLKPEQLIC